MYAFLYALRGRTQRLDTFLRVAPRSYSKFIRFWLKMGLKGCRGSATRGESVCDFNERVRSVLVSFAQPPLCTAEGCFPAQDAYDWAESGDSKEQANLELQSILITHGNDAFCHSLPRRNSPKTNDDEWCSSSSRPPLPFSHSLHKDT